MLWIVLLVSACRTDKLPEPSPSECMEIPTYESQLRDVINASCAIELCHDDSGAAPGNFLSYQGMLNRLDNGQILDRVFTKGDMPLAPGELSQEDREMLRCWLDNNYPEQ